MPNSVTYIDGVLVLVLKLQSLGMESLWLSGRASGEAICTLYHRWIESGIEVRTGATRASPIRNDHRPGPSITNIFTGGRTETRPFANVYRLGVKAEMSTRGTTVT